MRRLASGRAVQQVRFRRSWHKSGQCAIICAAIGAPTRADTPVLEHWRSGENGPANALYVMARATGKPVDYAGVRRVVDADHAVSMAAVSACSGKLGVNLTPARLTYEQLCAADGPVLVHLERQGVDSGSYAIVAFAGRGVVVLFDPGCASWAWFNPETFRRDWSNYALIVAPGRRSAARHAIAIGILGWAACAGLVAWYRRTQLVPNARKGSGA